MLIRIVYRNEKYDLVKPLVLNRMLADGRVKKFLRSGGWTNTGTDRMRGIGGDYKGSERRTAC